MAEKIINTNKKEDQEEAWPYGKI